MQPAGVSKSLTRSGHGERVAATGRAFRSLSLYWDSRGWT